MEVIRVVGFYFVFAEGKWERGILGGPVSVVESEKGVYWESYLDFDRAFCLLAAKQRSLIDSRFKVISYEMVNLVFEGRGMLAERDGGGWGLEIGFPLSVTSGRGIYFKCSWCAIVDEMILRCGATLLLPTWLAEAHVWQVSPMDLSRNLPSPFPLRLFLMPVSAVFIFFSSFFFSSVKRACVCWSTPSTGPGVTGGSVPSFDCSVSRDFLDGVWRL